MVSRDLGAEQVSESVYCGTFMTRRRTLQYERWPSIDLYTLQWLMRLSHRPTRQSILMTVSHLHCVSQRTLNEFSHRPPVTRFLRLNRPSRDIWYLSGFTHYRIVYVADISRLTSLVLVSRYVIFIFIYTCCKHTFFWNDFLGIYIQV